MSNKSSTSERVGQAWHQHREGRSEAAINEFATILRLSPDDIDAHYGMGLAQRAAGRHQDAIETFEKALGLIEQAKTAYEATRQADAEDSNVKTPEDDRFMMLSRMVRQRLSEMRSVNSQ
jgi:tetratricopeptide (TPR) repeat protein